MSSLPERPQSADDLLQATLGGLDTADVRWALASGRDTPRPGARDVDLVVGRRELGAAHALLVSRGFVHRRVRGPNRLYVGYDPTGDVWHTLDVASSFRVGPCVVDGAWLLKKRRRVGALWTLAADDAFWLGMLAALAARAEIPLHDRADLRDLAADAGVASSLARLATFWSPPGWSAARIRAAAAAGEWDDLGVVCRTSRPRPTSPASGVVVGARGLAGRTVRRLGRALPRRGFALAVIGPDGAGKSTLAASIVERFALPGRVYYMGLHAPVGDVGGHVAPARRKPLAVRVRRQVRRLLRLARTAAHAELTRLRGRLVVFDRYTYDADVHWAAQPGTGARVRRWLVRHAAPRPDLTIVLDVPADVMFARKSEHSPVLLDARRRRYLELARRSRSFAVIDGTQPAEEVCREACRLAWAEYAGRGGAARASPARHAVHAGGAQASR
jgi:thymidylate kinase